ncbi:hypothetical protein [Loigolactobacillus zhaoyuanensis]|uniref:Uncharacterized protein n=1 Tax=Loigolactobacillus zhaoyuanensis TaxID=2486017 RepID=A0ABW8UBY9_9LACO|nr:hypothetical protein [Loigolactobacillus zhaoyuanensis]
MEEIATVKFYFWADQKDQYCEQLTDISRIYFDTKLDQAKLATRYADQQTPDFLDIETTTHLYTHILMLAQLWQQQVADFVQHQLTQQKIIGAALNYRLVTRFLSVALTADETQKMDVAALQQLHDLAAVIKTGNDRAIQRLRKSRADFFQITHDPRDFSGRIGPQIDIFAALYANHAVLKLSELDLLNFINSAKNFWQQAPETLAVDRETLLAMVAE